MNDLMALNLFAMSLPAALVGMGLFGGLVLLPLFFRDDRRDDSGGRPPHRPEARRAP
jgi:hypothetical protein